MGLLNDQALAELIAKGKLISNGLDEDYIGEKAEDKVWFKKNSAVQPASIDLHVGEIYVPGSTPEQQGGVKHPMTKHAIGPGETAVIRTKEALKIPGDIAAFGFPPDSVSSMGILMTNPGHIDPGFEGKLKFTLINMSKKSFPVSADEVIATLLFIKIEQATKDYQQRRQNGKNGEPKQSVGTQSTEKGSVVEHDPRQKPQDMKMAEMLDSLNHDFMDINVRTDKAIKTAARTILFRGTLIVSLVTALIAFLAKHFTSTDVLKAEVEILKSQIEVLPQIKELKKELDSLKMVVTRDTVRDN